MISISFESVLSSVPLLMALFWPFVASFFGFETVLRQSLVICIYFIICDLIQRAINSLFKIEMQSLLQILNSIILIILLSQPFVIIPTFIISLFSFSLKYCEPFIILIEVKQLIRIINKFGLYLSDVIHSNDNETKSLIMKMFVLTITTISYSLAFFIIRSGLMNAETVVFTYASVLLILFQVILIIATIYVEEGIISDTSLVFLASSLSLYLSIIENNNKNQYSNSYNQMQWLENTRISSDGKSLIYQLLSLPDVSSAYASEGLRWAKQHYGMTFWFALIIRITCVLSWLIDHYFLQHNQTDYDCYNDDEQSIQSYGSYIGVSANTLIKVMATLIYTQMLLQQLPDADSWPSLSIQWLQSLFRITQSFFLEIYYFYTLLAVTTDD